MRLEIYDEKSKDDITRLRLIKSKEGIMLCAVDVNGEIISQGRICSITTNGLYRNAFISSEIGIEIETGKIKVVN